MTLEEKRAKIKDYCHEHGSCCVGEMCPLFNTDESCYQDDKVVNRNYDILFGKDQVKTDDTSFDREKYIDALEELCRDCNGCENCPIGKIEHNQKFCVDNHWADMDDYALKTLAEAAGIVIGEEEIAEDPVNHPSHYTSGGIECLDALEASMTPIEYAGFLKGQVFKYIWRYRLKGKPVQDLKKARFYLDRLIQITEKEEAAV